MTIRWLFRILSALAGIILVTSVAAGQTASPSVNVLTVKGTVNPVLVDYIKRGTTQAEASGATALIIQLDTPGGLDTAMRDIVQSIVNSRVPVVVYVSPSGARAASAGTFITLAAHVAAMAPNTAIGAAHPVAIGETVPGTVEDKVVNDAAAYIRSIAEAHGRSAEWAERAVRESVSATETEALSLKVIDMVAPDLDALVRQLDGREVTLLGGQKVVLQTAGALIRPTPMTAIERFLYAIADPNIAYILLSLAVLGIMAEIFNPGLIFPGVVGAISLLLAFFSLGFLPVNYTGLLLILLAFGLFIAEVFVPGFGLLTAGGVISLVIGSLILFKGGSPLFRVDPGLIALVTILIAGFVTFAVFRVVAAHRTRATTGREELIGKTAVARTPLEPEGLVFYKGERWEAISEQGRIEAGEEVVITRMDGLRLYVNKKTRPTS